MVDIFQKMCILKKNYKISNNANTIILYKYINYNLFSALVENESAISSQAILNYLNAYLPSDLKNKCISSYKNYYNAMDQYYGRGFKTNYNVSDVAEILPDGNILTFCEGEDTFYYNIKNNIIIPLLHNDTTIIHTKSNQLFAIGGYVEGYHICTGEIYDSIKKFSMQENEWKTLNTKLIKARYETVLVEMLDGQILIIGGRQDCNLLSTTCHLVECELFDPKTDTIKQTCSLNIAREGGFSACLLSNGCVLVSGGYFTRPDNTSICTNCCEIYDPVANVWTIVKPMKTERANHYSCLLNPKEVAIFNTIDFEIYSL